MTLTGTVNIPTWPAVSTAFTLHGQWHIRIVIELCFVLSMRPRIPLYLFMFWATGAKASNGSQARK